MCRPHTRRRKRHIKVGGTQAAWDAFAVTPLRLANRSFRLMDEPKGHAMAKNTICLWYDKDAETAARFYAETFPDSAVGAVHRAPSNYPSGKAGDVLTVEFTV